MIREKLGLSWAKFKLRKRGESPPIYFARTVRAMKKLLICLPKKEPEAEEAVKVLIEGLKPQFVIIVTRNEKEVLALGDHSPGRVVSLAGKNLGWFLIPKDHFLQALSAEDVDVAVDFNHPFSLTSAYLCARSGAIITAGFYSPSAPNFFNLEYNSLGSSKPKSKLYMGLAETLVNIGSGR